MSYPVFAIDPKMSIEELVIPVEGTGYLRKFWVEHPQLGQSLIKIEEDTAPAWSEKISYEIAARLELPAAPYEFGELIGWSNYADRTKVIVSPNFKSADVRYIQGTELLASQTNPDDSYTVSRILETLAQNDIQLPSGYQAPFGISNGADLMVGYLLLDSLVANNDRHSGNWEIGLDNRGVKTLAPVYDNGASFATTFGSIVYDDYTAERYMKTDLSYFGEFQIETFRQAAQIRPNAGRVWLSQLSKIEQQQLDNIFTQIPSDRIDSKALVFSRELLNYNCTQLLSLESSLTSSPQSLNDLYLRYAQNTESLGLSKAKNIAKNALIDGIEPERITEMLIDNNAAYRNLVSRSGEKQAQKMIVKKAQMELATSKSKQSSDGQTRPNQKSPKIR